MIQQFYEIPSRSTPPQTLVILLHGYGADGQNMTNVAYAFHKNLPDAYFLMPDAPEKMLGAGGYQWFDLLDMDPATLRQGCVSACKTVEGFVRKAQEKHKVSWQNTVLIGFSQGAFLALHTALAVHNLCGKVIAYAGGVYVEPEDINVPPQDLKILLIHGEEDDVVPPQESERTASFLKKQGFSATLEIIPDLDHSMNRRGVDLGVAFITKGTI
jgi:phospholipase/carboxylesterase